MQSHQSKYYDVPLKDLQTKLVTNLSYSSGVLRHFPEHIGPLGCTQCRDHRCCRFPLYSRTQRLENALVHEVLGELACLLSLMSHLRKVGLLGATRVLQVRIRIKALLF